MRGIAGEVFLWFRQQLGKQVGTENVTCNNGQNHLGYDVVRVGVTEEVNEQYTQCETRKISNNPPDYPSKNAAPDILVFLPNFESEDDSREVPHKEEQAGDDDCDKQVAIVQRYPGHTRYKLGDKPKQTIPSLSIS